MKTKMWMKTGMMIAVMGAFTLADAKSEKDHGDGGQEPGQAGHVEKGKKGEGKGPGREATMKKYDKDGDGQLSDAELQTLKADRTAAYEKGPRAGKRPSREEMIKKFDTDGDGQLNEEERAAARAARENRGGSSERRQEMMKKIDADGDGQISDEERAAAREAFEKKRKERENGDAD